MPIDVGRPCRRTIGLARATIEYSRLPPLSSPAPASRVPAGLRHDMDTPTSTSAAVAPHLRFTPMPGPLAPRMIPMADLSSPASDYPPSFSRAAGAAAATGTGTGSPEESAGLDTHSDAAGSSGRRRRRVRNAKQQELNRAAQSKYRCVAACNFTGLLNCVACSRRWQLSAAAAVPRSTCALTAHARPFAGTQQPRSPEATRVVQHPLR